MITAILILSLCGVLSCDQGIYVDADTLKTPTFDSASGTRFEPSLAVTIQNPNGAGSEIRYTSSTNGTAPADPILASTLWNNPTVTTTSIIKIKAFQSSYTPSATATATYYKVWTTKATMGTARRGAAVVAMNGSIYVIGGRSGAGPFTYHTTVEEFTPAIGTGNGTWVTKAVLQTARAYAAVAVADGKIYVFGGGNASGLVPLSNSVEEYTWATGTGGGSWIYKAPLPTTNRAYSSASEYNGKIYVTGGENGSGLLDRIDEFTPAAGVDGGTWVTKTSVLGTARKEHATITMGSSIYIIGGESSTPLKTMEIYNPTNNSISYGSSMASNRYQFAYTQEGSHIYSFGGYLDSTPTYLSSIEKYSVSGGWETDTFTLAQGRAEMGAGFLTTSYGNLIYLAGGRTSVNTEITTMEEFAP